VVCGWRRAASGDQTRDVLCPVLAGAQEEWAANDALGAAGGTAFVGRAMEGSAISIWAGSTMSYLA